jgi:hypothetical protein
MSTEELIKLWKPDVILRSGCAMHVSQARNLFQGYRFVRAVPWLVYTQGIAERGQCIYVRPTYVYAEQLETKVGTLGAPPIPDLWYQRLYFLMKDIFGQ